MSFLCLVRIAKIGDPARIYLLKVNNRNTKTRCEICSMLTVKTPPGVFIVTFERISHLVC